jgi:hypothetical protein
MIDAAGWLIRGKMIGCDRGKIVGRARKIGPKRDISRAAADGRPGQAWFRRSLGDTGAFQTGKDFNGGRSALAEEHGRF